MIAFLFSNGFKEGLLQAIALGLHDLSASLSFWLIGIHIFSAVYSRLKGEMIWHTMVPFWNEEETVNKIPHIFIKIESLTFKIFEKILSLTKKKGLKI